MGSMVYSAQTATGFILGGSTSYISGLIGLSFYNSREFTVPLFSILTSGLLVHSMESSGMQLGAITAAVFSSAVLGEAIRRAEDREYQSKPMRYTILSSLTISLLAYNSINAITSVGLSTLVSYGIHRFRFFF